MYEMEKTFFQIMVIILANPSDGFKQSRYPQNHHRTLYIAFALRVDSYPQQLPNISISPGLFEEDSKGFTNDYRLPHWFSREAGSIFNRPNR